MKSPVPKAFVKNNQWQLFTLWFLREQCPLAKNVKGRCAKQDIQSSLEERHCTPGELEDVGCAGLCVDARKGPGDGGLRCSSLTNLEGLGKYMKTKTEV